MKKILFVSTALFTGISYAQTWNTSGNSGISSVNNFLGTTDNNDLVFKTNNTERIKINAAGQIGIGANPVSHLKLNLFGSTEFNTDSKGDSYHFFNEAQTLDPGGDLMWLSYKNYQANDIGMLTLSTPPTPGNWSQPIFSIRNSGKVFVGVSYNNYSLSGCSDCNEYKLFVKDGIKTEKIKVDIASTNGWADYVFAKGYKLKTLEEVENHIQEKGHLPNIPSAEEVTKNGVNLGEMDAKLLEKIEELTLYTIELNKQIKKLQEDIKGKQNNTK